jgi:hypothetical protein
LAEYEYQVSGKLSNGKSFTQDLSPQNGGDVVLTIDQIPGHGASSGYLRFHQVAAQFGITDDVLNLDSGRLVKTAVDQARVSPIGYIDLDLKFHTACNWALEHTEVAMALHSRNFKAIPDLVKSELANAQATKNNDVIATALCDQAWSQDLCETGTPEAIERTFAEAIALANDRSSDASADSKWSILCLLARFYEKQHNFNRAAICIERSIDSAQKSDAGDKQTTVRDLKFILAREQLLAGRQSEATTLIKSINQARGRDTEQAEMDWQASYPHIALLEHEIELRLKTDASSNSCHVIATFNLLPSKGPISDFKIVSQSRPDCSFEAYKAILGAGRQMPGRLPTQETVHCDVELSATRDGSIVIIRRQK